MSTIPDRRIPTCIKVVTFTDLFGFNQNINSLPAPLPLSDLPDILTQVLANPFMRTPFAQVVLNPFNFPLVGFPYTYNECCGETYPLLNTFRILISPEVWFVPTDGECRIIPAWLTAAEGEAISFGWRLTAECP